MIGSRVSLRHLGVGLTGAHPMCRSGIASSPDPCSSGLRPFAEFMNKPRTSKAEVRAT
jgi:hypothetical protein